MSDLAELLARVEAATDFDRDLDRDIGIAIDGWKVIAERTLYVPFEDTYYADHPGSMYPSLTESIDAAVSLADRITHRYGRKLICFFCAGGQLMPHNADDTDPDYHPLAKIDNSVTVGWLSHVAFFKPDGGETYGPERYSHGANAALAIIAALLRALIAATP